MLEKDAKQKVCPFMSKGETVPTLENGTTFGANYELYKVNCLGCDCMAWVYTKEYEFSSTLDSGFENYERGCYIDFHGDLKLEGLEFRKKLDDDLKEGHCIRLKEEG